MVEAHVDEQGTDRRRVREIEVLLSLIADDSGELPSEGGLLPQASGPPGRAVSAAPFPAEADLGRDLRIPIRLDPRSPFSVFGLLEESSADLACIEGRTLEDAFLDPATPVKTLDQLKTLGKILALPGVSERASLLGRALYFLSAAAARVHAGTEISSMDRDTFRAGIEALRKAGGLGPGLLDLCREALEARNGAER
jgi:hypothetical protein